MRAPAVVHAGYAGAVVDASRGDARQGCAVAVRIAVGVPAGEALAASHMAGQIGVAGVYAGIQNGDRGATTDVDHAIG